MALSIASLNSGSNGNCYYIGNQREAVLIDAGISSRETDRRIKRLGLKSSKSKSGFYYPRTWRSHQRNTITGKKI